MKSLVHSKSVFNCVQAWINFGAPARVAILGKAHIARAKVMFPLTKALTRDAIEV